MMQMSNTIRIIVLVGLQVGLGASAQSAEPTTNQATNPPAPTLSQATQSEKDSTKPRHTARRTEIQQLRVEVRDLRRDLQHLVQLLEAQLPNPSESDKRREEPLNAPQDAPNVVQLPEDANSTETPPSDADGPRATWNLTLREAIFLSLANCPTVQLQTRQGESGDILIRPRDAHADVASTKAQVTRLIRDVEVAYIDLWTAHGKYRTARQARDASLDLWRQLVQNTGSSEGTVEQKAAAWDQYSYFAVQLKESSQLMQSGEQRLRTLLGLTARDERAIVPAGLPDLSPPDITRTKFDEMLDRAFRNSPDIQQQTEVLRQCELQLISWEPTKAAPESDSERGRRAELRNQALRVARERARLEDIKLNASHLLTTSVRNLDYCRQVLQTHRNRRTASENEIRALSEMAHAGKPYDVDLILNAHRRWAAACIDCLTESAFQFSATSDLHIRQGTLLEFHGVSMLPTDPIGVH
jgi:hypothetical protein